MMKNSSKSRLFSPGRTRTVFGTQKSNEVFFEILGDDHLLCVIKFFLLTSIQDLLPPKIVKVCMSERVLPLVTYIILGEGREISYLKWRKIRHIVWFKSLSQWNIAKVNIFTSNTYFDNL